MSAQKKPLDLDAAAKELTDLQRWRDQWSALGLMVPDLSTVVEALRTDIPHLEARRLELKNEVDGIQAALDKERKLERDKMQTEHDKVRTQFDKELENIRAKILKESQEFEERTRALKAQQEALIESIGDMEKMEITVKEKLKTAEAAFADFKRKTGLGG